jgi:UDP-2,4-diacetamido-2,4,6-trideoxy-beta-L-altropyranose hydrolase
VFRADASVEGGTGHIMRCISLAQHWKKAGGKAVFVTAANTPLLRERLAKEMSVVELSVQPGSLDDSTQTVQIAQNLGASWIVLDGYNFKSDFQKVIKSNQISLLVIDDFGSASHYYSDIVLNQNIYANTEFYANKESYTRLLLGCPYVILRNEFLRLAEWERKIPKTATKLLVTLGGSDPKNVTQKIVEAIQNISIDNLSVIVVAPNNLHFEKKDFIAKGSRINMEIRKNVTNMSDLMAWADVAVSAGGTSTWELAFMGLPMILTAIADNQRRVVEEVGKAGVAINLGWHENISLKEITQAVSSLMKDAELRGKMSSRGKHLVDGLGAERVLAEMNRVCNNDLITLRQACESDAENLWNLANDPDVRAASFSTSPILWENHVLWLKKTLDNQSCTLFIALSKAKEFIGQVRYDVIGKEATVSISLKKDYRCKGYGSKLISLSAQKIFNQIQITTIHAYVKQENESSITAFTKANFKTVKENIHSDKVIHLVLEREGQGQ